VEFKRLNGMKVQELAGGQPRGRTTTKLVLMTQKMTEFAENLAKAVAPTTGQPLKGKRKSGVKSVDDSQLPGEQASASQLQGRDITAVQFERVQAAETQTATCDADAEILVPAFVTAKFKVYAERSFSKGIESLGILLGQRLRVPRFKRELWVVECLFIPQQSGTKDTCKVTPAHDPELLLRKCLEHGWQALGWIHTHPTYDAFLSSVDQHMQFHHQSTGPHCVAAVVGKDGNTEFFKLTEDGMNFIATCHTSGFHEHPAGMVEKVVVATDQRRKGYVFDEEVPACNS
jgi:hypothetical protein